MVTEQFRDRISSITNIPTLPEVATKLIQTVNNKGTSATEISNLIAQDISLSAKVLRLSNSAFYGMPRSITNINNAVVILGLRVINTLVLSLTVFDLFADDDNSQFDRKRFWDHSFATGMTAKFLANNMQKSIFFDPEEAFCAGLLHDIGKIVMEQYMHDDFHQAITAASEKKLSQLEAENTFLGYNHTDVASWLIDQWGLPMELQMPIMYHHQPASAPFCKEITALVHFADAICYEHGYTSCEAQIQPKVDRTVIDSLALPKHTLSQLNEWLPDEMDKMTEFFKIARE